MNQNKKKVVVEINNNHLGVINCKCGVNFTLHPDSLNLEIYKMMFDHKKCMTCLEKYNLAKYEVCYSYMENGELFEVRKVINNKPKK